MQKKTTVAVWLLLMAVAYLFISNYSKNAPCNAPPRNANIPADTFWQGGCDGGSWFYLGKENPEKQSIQIKIFSDQAGNLIADNLYSWDESCRADRNFKKLSDAIEGFEGDNILTSVGCSLKPKKNYLAEALQILDVPFHFLIKGDAVEVSKIDKDADVGSAWGSFKILSGEILKSKGDVVKLLKKNRWYPGESCQRDMSSPIADRPGCFQFTHNVGGGKSNPPVAYTYQFVLVKANKELLVFFRVDGE